MPSVTTHDNLLAIWGFIMGPQAQLSITCVCVSALKLQCYLDLCMANTVYIHILHRLYIIHTLMLDIG